MGCCSEKPLKEKLIEHKEALLQFTSLTAPQILEAFKGWEDSLSIKYPEIIQTLKNLKISYSEGDERVVLKPFLALFQKESIKVQSDEEYDHRMLKSVMILMSKSNDSVKSRALFESFDVGHNNSLGMNELDFMLRSILNFADQISLVMAGEEFQKTDIIEKIKTEIFDKILRKTENLCFEGETSENLTMEKFELKILTAKQQLSYDFLSTAGLRKTLQEWVRFKDSVKKNEPITLKH